MTDNTVAKRNRTNNDLQNTTQKTKDGSSQTPLNTGVTSGAGTYPSGASEFTLVLSGVRVTRSLVLYVCFVDRCLSFCTFSFGIQIVPYFAKLSLTKTCSCDHLLLCLMMNSFRFLSGKITGI
jgi:hypothetical protein